MRAEVRQFTVLCRARGIECWWPVEGYQSLPCPKHNPRIITQQEMGAMIGVADRLQDCPWAANLSLTYGMLLRMLWCCGTRIGETLMLRVGDVDADQQVITIRHAKAGKTRLVPMSASLAEHAIGYARQTGVQNDPGSWFYPGSHSGHLSHSAAHRRIHLIMREAGVTVDGLRPARVHDIRHSSAVAMYVSSMALASRPCP